MSQCENEEQSFDVEQKVLASLSLSACLLAHVVLRLLGVTGLTALLVSLMVGAVAGATGALLICSLCRPPMDALELHTWFCDHVPTINRWLVRRDRYKLDRAPPRPSQHYLESERRVGIAILLDCRQSFHCRALRAANKTALYT